jgi:hydrogenase maturation protein HypF
VIRQQKACLDEAGATAGERRRAVHVQVRGVVQGVGFRPTVFRLARDHALNGWVLNAEHGVDIHVEGSQLALEAFLRDLKSHPPPAAAIDSLDVDPVKYEGFTDFTIRSSVRSGNPTVRVSPDLCVCSDCLTEMFDPAEARAGYPYINCTNCGPRYSIIEDLPYDRARTTMRAWQLCASCDSQYHDPTDRRFHAQPIACPKCGPLYWLRAADGQPTAFDDRDPVRSAASLLARGGIVATKGLGGYHLACDATNATAVDLLRSRKFRKEQPFALMARDLEVARSTVELSPEAIELLQSVARPIVLGRALVSLPGVAPDNRDYGVMLPYAPLHHLLFTAGAPPLLVMTSANRSGEPLAYVDDDAFERLGGLADAFLVGERPIARRVDDSVVCVSVHGPTMLRRARGYAPGAVTIMPAERPVLALGADLKNTITLVVDHQAFMSQYIGDLEDARTVESFKATIGDLMRLYDVPWKDVLVVCDAHPGYRSTAAAEHLPAGPARRIQHHRAHIASVLAERQEWDTRVVGASFDGTGFGDDWSTWGGEFFVGSVRAGFARVACLRPVRMVGGDAAARHPVQAAAGFVEQLDDTPDFTRAPFNFPTRFVQASALLHAGVRVAPSTSMGRLFDTIAALVGFTRPTTYEGQAAIWLEHLSAESTTEHVSPFPFHSNELDFRVLLDDVVKRRLSGERSANIAWSAQIGIAHGVYRALIALAAEHAVDIVVVSGGVFQNQLLLSELHARCAGRLQLWTNRVVPPNDGGISLGQAALAALGPATGS